MTQQIVILADESANWKIAGLRQLDRLTLAIDRFLQRAGDDTSATVVVLWKPQIASERKWSPSNLPLKHAAFAPRPLGPVDLILSTRLFFFRNGIGAFRARQALSPLTDVDLIESKFEELDRSVRSLGSAPDEWEYLDKKEDIPALEIAFLGAAGKSQDGLVAKFLNRPISRCITRLLLHYPITPNQWTLATSLLALPACLALAHGSYFGIVLGTLLYQLISILDGCDGEIARAKYLESERGRRFDAFCDLVINLLFVLSLGIGLYRREETVTRWIYLSEAILSVSMVAARLARYARDLLGQATHELSPQHENIIRDSGAHFLGSRFTAWLFQITKRDVAFLAFAILAIAGCAPWILHCFFAFALGSLILSWRGRAAGEVRAGDKIDIALE